MKKKDLNAKEKEFLLMVFLEEKELLKKNQKNLLENPFF